MSTFPPALSINVQATSDCCIRQGMDRNLTAAVRFYTKEIGGTCLEMAKRLGVFGLLAAMAVAVAALPLAAQEAICPAKADTIAGDVFSKFTDDLPKPPCAEPSLPPGTVKPVASQPRSQFGTPDKPLVADYHVASTELGFEKGVAPAPGLAVTYQGKKYRVTDVQTEGGGPSFSGGSRFVIGVMGSSLIVGLKSYVPGSDLDPERFQVSAIN
jgi:hypothetical protein